MKALMYHYVRPGHGGLPFLKYLHSESFRQQLDWLGKNFGFVDRSDFLRSLDDGIPRPGAILTFDDAFRDHYDHVFPELRRRGLWGIFYVPTGVYESRRLLDVHRLHLVLGRAGGAAAMEAAEEILDDGMLVDAHIDEFRNVTYAGLDDDAATVLFKRTLNYFISYEYRDQVIDKLVARLLDRAPQVEDFYLAPAEIRAMHDAGMVIGSHTVNHLVMSKLNDAEQRFEIENSRDFLRSIIDAPVESFCYPYGGFHTFTERTEAALKEAGYRYSFNVEPRDIEANDLQKRSQALPRFDCNQFPHGRAEPFRG